MEVNHIDENKDNNSISNLNLMTPKENCNWGTRNERSSKAISKALKGRNLSEEHKGNISKALKGKANVALSKQVGAFKDGELMMTFPSISEAGRNGFSIGNICSCCNGLRNFHKGYQWQYM